MGGGDEIESIARAQPAVAVAWTKSIFDQKTLKFIIFLSQSYEKISKQPFCLNVVSQKICFPK